MIALDPLVFLALTLIALFGSPQTTVELRVTSVDEGQAKLLEQALLRELGERLLEDGYRVVPVGRSANVRVWIHVGSEGATIDMVDTRDPSESHRTEIVAAGERELVSLEIQQLTSALIAEVPASEALATDAVALDLGGSARDPELRERLQSGLLARGFALTRRASEGDRRLCVERSDFGATRVRVVAGSQSCAAPSSTELEVAQGSSFEITSEMVIDEAAAALETWAESASTVELASSAVPASSVEPALETDEGVETSLPGPEASEWAEPGDLGRRAWSVTPSLHGGLLARSGGPDGWIGFGLRVGRQRGLGAGLELGVVPSKAVELRVIETMPTALFDYRVALRERGLVALGLFGGLHLHSYVQAGATGQRDTRVGASVGTTARVAYLARRGPLLFAGVRAGWSGGGWVHLHQGSPSWQRSALLVGFEVGAGWDFAWRARR